MLLLFFFLLLFSNANGEMIKDFFFFFSPAASKPIFKYKFIGHLLKPGPDVTLKCIAAGTPTPQVTWTIDGVEVSPSEM